MFDTKKVAKKIKDARIAKNMTQMNLADAMGVSYQAVSNWERGNSMPDISKLEDLCRELDISINELLGAETRETIVVEKIVKNKDAELTMEELGNIAPMLPPKTVNEQVKKASGKKYNIKALAEIVMFMDDDLLEELLDEVEPESLKELEPLAPFLNEDVLDKLVRRAPENDFEGIAAVAPHLDEDTVDYLVKRCDGIPDKKLLDSLLPFMGEETVDVIARRCAESLDTAMLEKMVPFMEDDTLDAVVDIYIAKGMVCSLSTLYPFMESKSIHKIAKALMAEGDLDALRETAVFL